MSEPSTARTLTAVLAEHAHRFGDTLFLVDEHESYTYAQTEDLAARTARGLASLGVGAGDVVALFMVSSARLAVTALAVNRLGAVWSPVNTDYRGEWLALTLQATRARVLVVDAALLPRILALPDPLFAHVVVHGGHGGTGPPGVALHDLAALGHGSPAAAVAASPGDTSAVLWTSGTTGRSKGVMQPHGAWLTAARRFTTDFLGGVRPGDRFYSCVPMYNSGAWVSAVFPALVSAQTACLDRGFTAGGFWDRVRHHRANHVMLLGAMTLFVWNAPERPDDADNPLRTAFLVPVPVDILEAFRKRIGVERVVSGFGQSEVMLATAYHSNMPGLKPGSCGYLLDDSPLQTVVLDQEDNPVGPGVTGEICVRPRTPWSIFSGYFDQPEESLRTFRNLWHHTGDLGRVDEDGELFFVDRARDSVRNKGRNISTFEVEHIARRFDGVAEVAAYGVKAPGAEFEEELMLAVVPAAGAHVDPLQLCRFIDDHAPYFFVPRYVEITERLPMTPTSKVQKFKLRDRGVTAATWDRRTGAPTWSPTRGHAAGTGE